MDKLKEVSKVLGTLNIPNRKQEQWLNIGNSSPNDRTFATVSLRFELPQTGKDLSSRQLAASAATVMHRYTGQDTVSFLMELPSSSFISTEEQLQLENQLYTIVQFNFSEGISFAQVMNQSHSKDLTFTRTDVKKIANVYHLDDLFRFGVVTNSFCEPLFEMNLSIDKIQTGTQLTYHLTNRYDSSIYLNTQMERLSHHLVSVLTSPQADKDINQIEILSKSERQHLLVNLNQIYPDDCSGFASDQSCLGTFQSTVLRAGENTAIVEDFGTHVQHFTYAQLHSQAFHLSSLLVQKGGGSNCPFVASLLPRGSSLILTSLASMMMNKTCAVIHNSYAVTQVKFCLESVGSPLLITTKEKFNSLALDHDNVFFIDEVSFPVHIPICPEAFPVQTNLNSCAYFTSGSTGGPKAVLLKDLSIMNCMRFCANTLGLSEATKAMNMVTPGFGLYLFDIWTSFLLGGSIYIPPQDVVLDLDLLLPWMYKYEIDNFFASTSVAEAILNTPVESGYLSKLKSMVFAGERIQNLDTTGRDFTICQFYGTTETLLSSFMILPKNCSSGSSPNGHSITNVHAFILDPHLQPVPVGVTGDIYISGTGLLEKYVNRESPLQPNPFEPRSYMYYTGDVGYWSEAGNLFVTGRKDSQVKIHGMRLELGEVEVTLQKFPGVKKSIVLMQTVGEVKQLIGFCSLKPGYAKPNVADVYAFLVKRVQRHAIPFKIHFVSEFPKTASEKIARGVLETELRAAKEEPRVDVEAGTPYSLIRKSWAKVLQVSEDFIQCSSNFFYLGGSSMHALQVSKLLAQYFPSTTPSLLFEFPVFQDFMLELLSKQIHNNETAEKFQLDTQNELSPQAKRLVQENRADVFNCTSTALVTGAAGFFGPFMLAEILGFTSKRVVCIVRAKNDEEAEARVYKQIARHNLSPTFEQFDPSRLVVHAGDIAIPKFGLCSSRYEQLCCNIDVIFHAAAEVNWMKSYAQLRNSTVAMARNVIKFATTAKLKWIHYMSSIAVFDGLTGKIAQEAKLPRAIDPVQMKSGYNQSKWVSEQLMWNAIDAGVPVSIYRLGEVGSHSSLPVVNREDAFGGFLLACKDLSSYPNLQVNLPYVSVDCAAKWVVALSTSAEKSGAFNIVERELSVAHCLRQHKAQAYTPVSLVEWESEFLSKNAFNTTSTVCGWLFLQALKDSKSNKEGFAIGRLSYSRQRSKDVLGKIPRAHENPVPHFIQTLFKSA